MSFVTPSELSLAKRFGQNLRKKFDGVLGELGAMPDNPIQPQGGSTESFIPRRTPPPSMFGAAAPANQPGLSLAEVLGVRRRGLPAELDPRLAEILSPEQATSAAVGILGRERASEAALENALLRASLHQAFQAPKNPLIDFIKALGPFGVNPEVSRFTMGTLLPRALAHDPRISPEMAQELSRAIQLHAISP
jgi:hypothetical protein